MAGKLIAHLAAWYIPNGRTDLDGMEGLTVDGVKADAETAKAKKYPISRDLYIYTNGAPAGAVKGLVDFLLGPDGQKLVKEVGFVPLS